MTTDKVIQNSSQVSRISYNSVTKILTITYKGGKENNVYEYEKVPIEVFDGLLAAESVGKYIHREIKGKYAFKFVG